MVIETVQNELSMNLFIEPSSTKYIYRQIATETTLWLKLKNVGAGRGFIIIFLIVSLSLIFSTDLEIYRRRT